MNLIVVNMHENHAVFGQQVFSEKEAGIHHAQPIAVEVSAVFAIAAEKTLFSQIAFFIDVADPFLVFLFAFLKGVRVNKTVIAGIIGRIDDDTLDFPVI